MYTASLMCRSRHRALATISELALSISLYGIGNTPAQAACSSNSPTDGETVVCTPVGGADQVGVFAPNASDITVIVSGSGNAIDTLGQGAAIDLGDRATVRAENSASIVSDFAGIFVGNDGDIEVGNILSSGKGAQAIRGEDRLRLVVREGGTVRATGPRSAVIQAWEDADITIEGTVTGDLNTEDAIFPQFPVVFTRDGAFVRIANKGRVEALNEGAAAVSVGRSSNVIVEGRVSASGVPDGFNVTAALVTEQNSILIVAPSGSVESTGDGSAAVNLNSNVADYPTPSLAQAFIAGEVQATGSDASAIVLQSRYDLFNPANFLVEANIGILETGVVRSRDRYAIEDDDVGLGGRPVDTTVRIAGTVEGSEAGGYAIFLGGGNDNVILLPTYSLGGGIIGSNDPFVEIPPAKPTFSSWTATLRPKVPLLSSRTVTKV